MGGSIQGRESGSEMLESWRAGELESWRAGELESWRADLLYLLRNNSYQQPPPVGRSPFQFSSSEAI